MYKSLDVLNSGGGVVPNSVVYKYSDPYKYIPRSWPSNKLMSLVTVEVFLKFELYLQLNLDLHLDSTKLGLGLGIVLGLDLARGQSGGAPNVVGDSSISSCLK